MTEINRNRRYDESQEAIINEFLMIHYFEKVFPTAKFIRDTALQQKGADVQINERGCKYIDVKAQSSARYINQPRPTFILELSTLNRMGEEIDGWFLNNESITDYYAFVWIHDASVTRENRIKSSTDIHKIEIMIVDKKQLKNYITQVLGNEDVYEVIGDMRYYEDTKQPLADGMHFSHSPQLPEKPVNIVVHKKILDKFTVGEYGHCFVTPSQITQYHHTH